MERKDFFQQVQIVFKKIKESSFLVHISQIFKIKLNNEIFKSSFKKTI